MINDTQVVTKQRTKRPRGLNAKAIKGLRRWAKRTQRYVEAYDLAQEMVQASSHKERGKLRARLVQQ